MPPECAAAQGDADRSMRGRRGEGRAASSGGSASLDIEREDEIAAHMRRANAVRNVDEYIGWRRRIGIGDNRLHVDTRFPVADRFGGCGFDQPKALLTAGREQEVADLGTETVPHH